MMISALTLCVVLAQAVEVLPADRTYYSEGLYKTGDVLVFDSPPGKKRPKRVSVGDKLAEWRLFTFSPKWVTLWRDYKGNRQARVFDRSGRQIGQLTMGGHQVAFFSDTGGIVLQEALHKPIYPHDIAFYNLRGKKTGHATDKKLTLFAFHQDAEGRLLTANFSGNYRCAFPQCFTHG